MNFDLSFKVLRPRTLKIFEIIFPLSNLMTSLREPQKSPNWLLASINYQDSLIHVSYELILSEIQLLTLIFKTE